MISRSSTSPSTQGFQFIAGNLALDFVNTVGDRLGNARDFFLGSAELDRWARLAGLRPERMKLSLNARQLVEIRAVREQLYGLFQPLTRGELPSAAGLASLNSRLASVASKRRLKRAKDMIEWEWNFPARDPGRILAPILASAAELLTSGAFGKLRQCEGEICGWLFLDRSNAGYRRWCSMADCGNRAKVRKHYHTQRKPEN